MLLRRAALVLLAASLAGCSTKEEPGGKVKVRFLANPDVGGFAKVIIDRFHRENPGIEVEMIEGPAASDARENLYASSFMAKEDVYDLIYMDVAWLPKFAAQGWLRPVDEWFTPEKQQAFLKGDLDGSRFQGKLWRIPLQSDGGVLYYRKDLLDSKGLPAPRTWAELVAAAKALDAPGRVGFVFQGKQYEGLVCAFLEFVWGFGGELIDAKGRVRIAEPAAVRALEAMVAAVRVDRIAPEAVLTYQEEEARAMFQEGHAVFMRNWPYAWNLMQQPGSPVRGKIGMVPMVSGGPGLKGAATLGGWGFGVSAFSRHPAEAWKVAEFFGTAESQKLAFLKGGILPTRKALFSDPDVLKANPAMKDLYKVLSLARPRPPHPRWARISDALQLHVSAALSGGETPAEALAEAAKAIRPVVER